MANRIDRDPEKILTYTQHVNTTIDALNAKTLSSLKSIDAVIGNLQDKNCRALYKDLLEKTKKFLICINTLKTENDSIEKEAKKLKTIIDEGIGGYKK